MRRLRETILPVKPSRVSVDRLGNIYLLGESRQVKLSEEGHLQRERDIATKEIALIDTWNPLRIWVYRKTGVKPQIQLLDQELMNAEEPFSPDESFALNPSLVAPGTNNFTYWILDEDRSLKQINTQSNSVQIETAPIHVPNGSEFINVKAYQGFIFLQGTDGLISIVNRLGQILRTIDTGGAHHFGVLGEDLYFEKGGKLIFENLYNDSRYEVKLPEPADYVLATDERLLIIKERSLKVFAFKPKS